MYVRSNFVYLLILGGLFPEIFYGLKRFPDPRSLDVSKKKVILWVFLSIVGPYLHSQLKNFYEEIREKQRLGCLNYKVSIFNILLNFDNYSVYVLCVIM